MVRHLVFPLLLLVASLSSCASATLDFNQRCGCYIINDNIATHYDNVIRGVIPPGFDGVYQIPVMITVPEIEHTRDPSYDPVTGVFADIAPLFIQGYVTWMRTINAQGGMKFMGQRLYVNMTIYNVGALEEEYIFNRTRDVIHGMYGPVPDVVFGPWSLTLSPVANACQEYGVILVGGGQSENEVFMCDRTLPDCVRRGIPTGQRRFHNYFSLIPFGSFSHVTTVTLLALRQVTSMVVLYEPDPYSIQVKDQAIETGVSFAMRTAAIRLDASTSMEQARVIAREVKSLQPGAFFGALINPRTCINMIRAFKEIDYLPGFASWTVCIAVPDVWVELGDDWKYMAGPMPWDVRLRGKMYQDSGDMWAPVFDPITNATVTSIQQFVRAFMTTHGTDVLPGAGQAITAAVGVTTMKALRMISSSPTFFTASGARTFNKTMPSSTGRMLTFVVPSTQLLHSALTNLYDTSFYGTISFDQWGVIKMNEFSTLQVDPTMTPQLVTPLASASAQLVYPIPQFSERTYVKQMFSKSAEKVAIGLSVVLVVFALLVAITMIGYRKTRVIRSTSIKFSLGILFGCIICFLAPLTWPVENDARTCAARPWLFSMGYMFVMSPLLAKTIRIAQIFGTNQLKDVSIHDAHVAAYMAIILLPQVIITAVWAGVAPLQPVVSVVDPLRPALNYTECYADGAEVFLYLSISYCSFLLLCACIVAFSIRNSYSLFNDAKPIFVAVFTLVFTLTFVGIVQGAIKEQSNRVTVFILRTLGVYVSFTATIVILFGAKLIQVLTGSGNADLTSSIASIAASTKNRRSNGRSHSATSTSAVKAAAAAAAAGSSRPDRKSSLSSQQGMGQDLALADSVGTPSNPLRHFLPLHQRQDNRGSVSGFAASPSAGIRESSDPSAPLSSVVNAIRHFRDLVRSELHVGDLATQQATLDAWADQYIQQLQQQTNTSSATSSIAFHPPTEANSVQLQGVAIEMVNR